MNILLKSAKIIDPKSGFHQKKQDILIEKGIITKIAKSITAKDNFKVIKLKNLHVSSGWFDSSVSLGEPGFEERETIGNGLKTAAMSGFTAIAVNPNTYPVIDSNADVTFLKSKAQNNIVSLYPIGAITVNSEGIDLAEIFDMKSAGAIAFGDYQKPISNPNLLKIALQYAQDFNGLVLSYPQENKIAGKGNVNEGDTSTRLGLKGIPAMAEELQIVRDLFILEYTGGKLHIPTISTAKSVQLIKDAKKKGLNVSCSVAIHNLLLTDNVLAEYNSNYKVLPPLRTKSDVKALIKGINDGTVDFVTSDHNPIDIEHKRVEFENAKNGTIGLESAFGVLNKVLDVEKTIAVLTNGRSRFGLETFEIKEGESANISLFNPDETYVFGEMNILSTSKNSAFIDEELKGKVYGIIANDQFIQNY